MYADYEKVKKALNGKGVVIGKSFFGRDIFAVKFGCGGVLIHGGIHAREHITTELVLEMINYNSKHNVVKNICFVPLVNPDGVELCLHGVDSVPTRFKNELLFLNGGKDFALWKANGRAVDLNLNFDADWGKGLGNVRTPAPHGFIGERPESESETKALVDLTKKESFSLTFSFHAKGEELYFGYNEKDYNPELTEKVSVALGYPSKTTNGSAGGYKDWCVLKRHIPAFTVEFGNDKLGYNELYSQKDELLSKCVNLLELVAKYE